MPDKRVKIRFSGIYYHFPYEAIVWITGLVLLACHHPAEGQHFTICLLKGLGFEHCPGCGLGRSVSMIFHGDFQGSWQTHPLGFVALGILIHRIFRLTDYFIREKILNKQQHGKCIETVA